MYLGKPLLSGNEEDVTAPSDKGYRRRYVAALLWDLLNLWAGPVSLPLLDGSMSRDLMDGIDKVIIPDELQSVAGYIPDFALLRDSRPVRAIVIVSDEPPYSRELEHVVELGVEVYMVPARSEEEMCRLFESYVDWRISWSPRFGPEDAPAATGGRLGKRPVSPVVEQDRSDKWMDEFMEHLRGCSPGRRRRFVSMLMGIGRIESLYPIRGDNPVKSSVMPARSVWDGEEDC